MTPDGACRGAFSEFLDFLDITWRLNFKLFLYLETTREALVALLSNCDVSTALGNLGRQYGDAMKFLDEDVRQVTLTYFNDFFFKLTDLTIFFKTETNRKTMAGTYA